MIRKKGLLQRIEALEKNTTIDPVALRAAVTRGLRTGLIGPEVFRLPKGSKVVPIKPNDSKPVQS